MKRSILYSALIALGVLGGVAVLGFQRVSAPHPYSRYVKAEDQLKTISEGFDQYKIKHGKYPDVSDFQSVVSNSSVFVQYNLIPVSMPLLDPWHRPYIAHSNSSSYQLICLGNPDNQDDFPAFMRNSAKPGSFPISSTP